MKNSYITKYWQRHKMNWLRNLASENKHCLILGYPTNGLTSSLIDLFKTESFIKTNKDVFIYLDLAHVVEQTPNYFIEQIFQKIKIVSLKLTNYAASNTENLIEETKRIVDSFNQQSLTINIIIDGFELSWVDGDSYFQYLKLIDLQSYRKINFIWIADKNLPWGNLYEIFGNQAVLFTQNINYVEPFDTKEWRNQKQIITQNVGITISRDMWNEILQMGTPQPAIIVGILRGLIGKKTLAEIQNQPTQELIWKLKRFEQNCSDEEWKLLQTIANNGKLPSKALDEHLAFFQKTGIISPNHFERVNEVIPREIPKSEGEFSRQHSSRSNWKINGTLLENWLKRKPEDTSLSEQQDSLLTFFQQRQNHPLTREQVAEALWGNQWEEHYSDWAIAQAIARLRRKLTTQGSNLTIKTLRNQGYIATSPSSSSPLQKN